jgi:hypothetical protein
MRRFFFFLLKKNGCLVEIDGMGWESSYHGHYDPVDFTQDDGSFGFEFFARVLAYFEIQICAYIAHLLLGGHVAFFDTGVSRGRYGILFFGHGDFCSAMLIYRFRSSLKSYTKRNVYIHTRERSQHEHRLGEGATTLVLLAILAPPLAIASTVGTWLSSYHM